MHQGSGDVLEKSIQVAAFELGTGKRLKRPKKYQVLLLNDDYTPMDFVVAVLVQFFHKSKEAAVQLMLEVHLQGKAVCGVFTRDIAETKVSLVNDCAEVNEYPLLCIMEPEAGYAG